MLNVNVGIGRLSATLTSGATTPSEKPASASVNFNVGKHLSFGAQVGVSENLIKNKKANLTGAQAEILDQATQVLRDESKGQQATNAKVDDDQKGAKFTMNMGSHGEVTVHYKTDNPLVKAAKVAVTALDVFNNLGQSLLAKTERLANKFRASPATNLSQTRLGLDPNATTYAKTSAQLTQPKLDPKAQEPETLASGMTAEQLVQAQANVKVGGGGTPKAEDSEKNSGVEYNGQAPKVPPRAAKPKAAGEAYTREESDAKEAEQAKQMEADRLALVKASDAQPAA